MEPKISVRKITVCSGDVINSISIVAHAAIGPFGRQDGDEHEIVVGDEDEVTKIYGTRGPNSINSLAVETAQGVKYGPFGKSEGEEFSFPEKEDDSPAKALIDLAEETLKSESEETDEETDDVLIYSESEETDEEGSNEVQPTNFGGLSWGYFKNGFLRPTMPSDRITKISLRCGEVVDRLSFSYTFNGETYTAGPWGGEGGSPEEVVIDDDDVLTGISGTYLDYYDNHKAVASLTFKTRKGKTIGPFGLVYLPVIWTKESFSFQGHILSFSVIPTARPQPGKVVTGTFSVETAYDLTDLHGHYDESREVYRKFIRVTTPDSVNFASRKAEDMQFSQAASLRGATALYGVSSDVQFMREKLVKFHNLLMNTNANWEDVVADVQNCAAQVENVSHDTEKAIHTFLNEVDKIIRFPLPVCSQRINSKLVNIYALYKLSKQIKEIKQNVENINDRDLGELCLLPTWQSPPAIDEAKLLGFEVHRNKIIKNLLDENRQIHHVSGTVKGSAKTILAEKIYQSAEMMDHFDECFWLIPHIYLFKPADILRKMLLKLGFTDSLDIHSEDDLISKLNDYLKGKRCLVIIDEYRTKLYAISRTAGFLNGDGGNIVFLIITDERVEDTTTEGIHELPSLNTSESLTMVRRLCERYSLEYDDYPPNFRGDVSLPRSVFENDGNPLFDPYFCHKTLLSWAGENQLFPIISCIFSQLPSSLKTCFAYTAAVFPYGSVVHASSLLQLWIVEGIIPQEDGGEREDIAQGCLKQLVQRGLLRAITTYYHNQADKPLRSVNIHLNLHRKFNIAARENAKSGNNCTPWEKEILPVEAVLVDDKFDISNYLGKTINDPKSTRFHRLALHLPCQFSHFYPFIEGPMEQKWNYPNLHSLFFFGSVASLACPPFTYLRVLAVFWAHIQFPEEDTPCALDGLINLRYLGFIVCMVEGGSLGKALGRLTKLETLDLSDSIVSGLSEFKENNSKNKNDNKVKVVGPGKEELRKFWSPIPDMAQYAPEDNDQISNKRGKGLVTEQPTEEISTSPKEKLMADAMKARQSRATD